jgi:hypothetical protein
MLRSRTLLPPVIGNALAGSTATIRGSDRPPKPGPPDDSRLAPLPPAPGIIPGPQASGTSSRSIGAPWPGLPAHPCAVTYDQPYRDLLHLGELAGTALHGNDRQLRDVRYRRELGQDVCYRVRIWQR